MSPTHTVTVRCAISRCMHLYQCFSLAYAEALLASYLSHGWTGVIERLPL